MWPASRCKTASWDVSKEEDREQNTEGRKGGGSAVSDQHYHESDGIMPSIKELICHG